MNKMIQFLTDKIRIVIIPQSFLEEVNGNVEEDCELIHTS